MFRLEEEFQNLPWLDELKQRLAIQIREDSCPSSLLVHGPNGSGRRQLVYWLCTEFLGGPPLFPSANGKERVLSRHPDFLALNPLEGKMGIATEQVREYIDFMRLTSHGGGNRVAVLYPADTLNRNGANALLKTLEEPPANAFSILIVESLSALPATVVSRCQQIRLVPPPAEVGLDWLRANTKAEKVEQVLAFSGGAPLAALELCEGEFAEFTIKFLNQINNLENKRAKPSEVARLCKSREGVALKLLERQILIRVRDSLEKPESVGSRGSAASPEVLACFRQMDQIRELRRVLNTGINAELGIAGLLLDWYGGLGHLRT